MREFDQQLLRLKQALGVTEDQGVAEALGLSKAAFADRKRRDAFPTDKLRALAGDRPELLLDVKYVLTGVSDELERRLAAIGTATRAASAVKEKPARYDIQQDVFDAIVGALSAEEQRLVHCYRNADARGKKLLLSTAATLADIPATRIRKKGAK